ncbi:hypothetical protein AAC03nite_31030 [Alicyclobacillus acidoterrestris]|uniref:hypothetical protein n=1 Tax=Alicyclobacillus suci TaxID=2816080 RepID=UPI00118F4287|nr:hypothetical protein [Alicyclobacillus suci]GEO27318.1 hypothetical protein AAC03nite_31030 [Alicyclobacillus acidoterrestris]
MVFNGKKWLVALCVGTLVLSGCGQNYNVQWTKYDSHQPGTWQVNFSKYLTDSSTEFQWKVYVGAKSTKVDYTDWTSNTTWKQISSADVKKQLGAMWRLVPSGHFYFYEFSVPGVNWWGAGAPSTMVGVATDTRNGADSSRVVHDILFRRLTDAPILLTTKPLQFTDVVTNQQQQSIAFTWKTVAGR